MRTYIKNEDGKEFEVTPNLRFIERDGKKVLQQLHFELRTDGGVGQRMIRERTPIWIDVSLVEEPDESLIS